MELDVILRKDQERYSHALTWLFDDTIKTKRTGRTHLLAVTFIKKAINHPNTWVQVFDHRFLDDVVFEIKNILTNQNKLYKFQVNNRGGSAYISYNPDLTENPN